MKIVNLKDKLLTCAILAAVTAAFLIFKIPCPIKQILGVECLGCGITRATVCALRFDFVLAFRLHFMFWSTPILLLYYLFDGHLFKNKIINYGFLIIIAAGFLINWAVHILY